MNTEPGDDDLDAWIDGLRGRAPAPGRDLPREALALRDLLTDPDSRQPLPPPDAYARQRLIFRLKREGLLQSSSWMTDTRTWALAAGVVAVALGLRIVFPGGEGPAQDLADVTAVRGVDGVPTLRVADPLARGQSLAADLQAAGSTVRHLPLPDGTYLVEVLVTAAQRPAVEQVLTPIGLAVPENGHLRIVLVRQ